MIGILPNVTKKCQDFIATSSEINTSRRLNSLTLKRNAQLLEILELPQLVDTCIRDGKYEEALELAAYVQRLGVKHGNVPIINVSFDCDIVDGTVEFIHLINTQLSEHNCGDRSILAHNVETIAQPAENRFTVTEMFASCRLHS